MYKVMYNNLVIDLLVSPQYVRYLKNAQKWIKTDSQTANGVMGSDNNTVYHLYGTICSCPKELKNVELVRIGKDEFDALSNQFAIQRQENEEVHRKLEEVQIQLDSQNDLLQKILSKLN